MTPNERLIQARAACESAGPMVDKKHLQAALDEVDLLTRSGTRLLDLVRLVRGQLFDESAITQEEYAALASVPSSPARLQSYDALRQCYVRIRTRLDTLVRAAHVWDGTLSSYADGPERDAVRTAVLNAEHTLREVPRG